MLAAQPKHSRQLKYSVWGYFLIQFDDDLAPTRGKDGEQAAVREVKAGRRVTPPFQWLPEFTVD